MIYADLLYDIHYSEMHDPIVEHLSGYFRTIQHGHQGDSWIWVFSGSDKVAIDTFYSMQHQVKSEAQNLQLIDGVLEILELKFTLKRYQQPELEAHEY